MGVEHTSATGVTRPELEAVAAKGLALALLELSARLDVEEPWRRDALCREYPEVDFFPGRGQDPRPAQGVCGRCPVRVECLEYGLGHDAHGVWGGTSRSDRREARRDLPVQRVEARAMTVRIFSPDGSPAEVEHDGERRTIAEWATCLGISPDTIYHRLHRGWTVDRALSTAVRRS